jgi:uncharacterized protein YndB with AHSA1/START domain
MSPQAPPDPTDHPEPAVRREVLLDAPVDDVWRAFSDDAGLAGWLADEVDLEVAPGASGTVRDGDGPDRPVRVDEVREGRGLSLVWADEAGVETLVDIALTPAGAREGGPGRTRVVVVELPVVAVSAVAVQAARILVGAPGGGASSPTAAASSGRLLAGAR